MRTTHVDHVVRRFGVSFASARAGTHGTTRSRPAPGRQLPKRVDRTRNTRRRNGCRAPARFEIVRECRRRADRPCSNPRSSRYALAFSQRIPPVQNIATFLCSLRVERSAKRGNSLNERVPGSIAAGKRAEFDLVAVARVDHGDIRIVEQTIPRCRIDVHAGSRLPDRPRRSASRSVPHARAPSFERRPDCRRQRARDARAMPQKRASRCSRSTKLRNATFGSGQRRIDAFVREQDRAAQIEFVAPVCAASSASDSGRSMRTKR